MMNYNKTQVFLICFSLIAPETLESISAKWIPEITVPCPNVPIILIGTKLDLRDDHNTIEKLKQKGLAPVSQEQGKAKAKQIKAVKYIECSAMNRVGLNDVFEEAVRTVFYPDKQKEGCVIM